LNLFVYKQGNFCPENRFCVKWTSISYVTSIEVDYFSKQSSKNLGTHAKSIDVNFGNMVIVNGY